VALSYLIYCIVLYCIWEAWRSGWVLGFRVKVPGSNPRPVFGVGPPRIP